jgi:hypothetical protein
MSKEEEFNSLYNRISGFMFLSRYKEYFTSAQWCLIRRAQEKCLIESGFTHKILDPVFDNLLTLIQNRKQYSRCEIKLIIGALMGEINTSITERNIS